MLLLGLLVPAAAHAGDETKTARPGDAATAYALTERGDLFRQIGKLRCQVTSRASELKVAQHPDDPAAAYFIKNGDLKVLLPPAGARARCPKAETLTVVPGIKRYTLMNDPASPSYALTLDTAGRFRAIGRDGSLEITQVTDFVMNSCHGQKGRAFSSYSAFVIDAYGMVTRIKGKEPEQKTDFTRAYASLEEFKAVHKVCAVP